MDYEIKRGDVYWVSFTENGYGREAAAHRPYVIVSADRTNSTYDTVIGVPLTTKTRWGNVNPEINSGDKKCWANCSQVTCLDKSRLTRYTYSLDEKEMEAMDTGLSIILALNNETDSGLAQENEELKARIAEYEEEKLTKTVSTDMWKKLYEKVLDELVSVRMALDLSEKTMKKEDPEPAPAPAPEVKVEINSCEESELRDIGCTPTMIHHIIGNRPYKNIEELKAVPSVTRVGYKLLENRIRCVPEEIHKVVVDTKAKVNVNTATPQEMLDIAGINLTLGNHIRAYRNKNGPFKTIEDLTNVKRFGPLCLKKYRDKLEV